MANGKKEQFCSGISQLHERLGKLRVASQYTNEADLSEPPWLNHTSH